MHSMIHWTCNDHNWNTRLRLEIWWKISLFNSFYIQLQLLFSLQPEVVRVIWTPIYHLPLLTLGLTAAKLCSSRAVVVLVIQSGPCCCSSRYVCISFWFQKWAGEKCDSERKSWNWIINISLFLETFNE